MTRLVFLGLCAAGWVSIAFAAWGEWSRLKRGEAVISKRQSRWRILSALLWLLILGSLGAATAFYWPENAPRETQFRFYSLVLGSMALLLIAVILLLFDVKLTLDAQKLSRKKFEAGLEIIAQHEIEKARADSSKPAKTNADSSSQSEKTP